MASSYDETLYAARLLIEAQTWPDRKRVVEERSNELFGEHIDQAFATILDQAHGCIDTIRAIEQMHTILDRCRSEGIDAAFEAFLPPTDSFTEMIEHIFEVVLSYVSAENWEERKHIVKSHSDILLSDVTGPTFDVLIDRYKEDEESLRLLEDCRALLKLCQKEGIDAAFTSFLVDLGQQIMAAVDAFVNTGTWRESKNIVETHRDKLLTDAADKVFADLIDQYREDTDAVKVLKDHRELLARCRRDGIEVAFAPYLSSRTQIQSPSRQVVEAVQAFVRAGTPIQQKQIVETRRDVLLTDEAEQVLTILIRRSANDPEASQLFRKHLNLLMHCRREGIDAAFANLLGYDHKIIDALLAFSRADTWEGRKDIDRKSVV